jgi:hypothetical protein
VLFRSEDETQEVRIATGAKAEAFEHLENPSKSEEIQRSGGGTTKDIGFVGATSLHR